MRKDEEHTVIRVLMADMAGIRKKGRPKTRWKDVCKRYVNTVCLSAVEAIDKQSDEEEGGHQPYRRPLIKG